MSLDTATGLCLDARVRLRNCDDIVAFECAKGGVSPAEFFGTSRRAPIVEVRHRIFAAMRERGFSYPAIGWMCGKDHSTVMAAIQKLSAQVAS